MQIIELDASPWLTEQDFLAALRRTLGCPDWHGSNLDAFIDSMCSDDINQVRPPYQIRISGTEHLSTNVKSYMALMAQGLEQRHKELRGKLHSDSLTSLYIGKPSTL